MKSISAKLFLSLIGLTCLVLSASLLLARWSFEAGFVNYVSAQEERRLGLMATDLAEHFSDNGGQWTSSSKDAYDSIYRKWQPSADRGKPPPPHFGGRLPPRIVEESFPETEIDSARRPPHGQDVRRSKAASADLNGPRRHSTRLVDLDGQYIAGVVSLPANRHQVNVSVLVDGSAVGILQTIADIDASASLESAFSKQQTQAAVIIALVSLLIACGASWWLVRMLLSPVLKMTDGVKHIAAGNYGYRLSSKRRDELGQLMRDIDWLAQTLEGNRLSRKRWIADISHELRTPVTILQGEIEAVLDGLRPLDMSQIQSLDHEVKRLSRLINDLYQLSLSDIGGLVYEYTSVDLVVFLNDFLDSQRDRFATEKLTFSVQVDPCDGPIWVKADVNRLEQLFLNIINNSIAYTDQPGELRVSIAKQSSSVLICFADSPPGVPSDHLEQLFEPLHREDASRNQRLGGAGLGLTICRNIVIAHEGSINAEVADLGGISINIEFPTIS